jgi:hypothetical protein
MLLLTILTYGRAKTLKLYSLLRNSKFTEVIILNLHMAHEPNKVARAINEPRDKTGIFACFVNEPSR